MRCRSNTGEGQMNRALMLFLLCVTLITGGLWTDSFSQNASHPRATSPATGRRITLPRKGGSLRFAVIGDTGTGSKQQYQLGEIMSRSREQFPFEFVLMLGDNMYGGESPRDFEKKFERPYKPLLDPGVKFSATLGNQDNPNQRFYKPFNMDGKQYYTYKKGPIRFFAMD